MACRRASCPTSRSPWSVKATTEGVVRILPRWRSLSGRHPPGPRSPSWSSPGRYPRPWPYASPISNGIGQSRALQEDWSLREAAGHDREARQQGKAAVVADAREGRSRPSRVASGASCPGADLVLLQPDLQQLPSERTEATPLPAAAPQTAIHPPSPRWQQSSTTRQLWRQAMIEGRHTSRRAPLWPRRPTLVMPEAGCRSHALHQVDKRISFVNHRLREASRR